MQTAAATSLGSMLMLIPTFPMHVAANSGQHEMQSTMSTGAMSTGSSRQLDSPLRGEHHAEHPVTSRYLQLVSKGALRHDDQQVRVLNSVEAEGIEVMHSQGNTINYLP